MGDYFQIIVDRDVSLPHTEILASKIQEWLVDEGIIKGTATNNCVLGGRLGYPPGPNCLNAVKNEDLFPQNYWTDGLEIITERTVFHPGQGGIEGVTCPECKMYMADETYFKSVIKAIEDWYSGNTGRLRCPNCSTVTIVTEWEFDPAWGFGNLGFKFWNWPPLKESFVANIKEKLGHRVILVVGKL